MEVADPIVVRHGRKPDVVVPANTQNRRISALPTSMWRESQERKAPERDLSGRLLPRPPLTSWGVAWNEPKRMSRRGCVVPAANSNQH
jgi:hypothetical protein